MNLLKYNRHWEKDFRYDFKKERFCLKTLKEHIEKKQITEITGLRRTGKTTLLFQVINSLLDRDVKPYNIWYFTFDEEKIKLDKLFSEFEKQTKTDFKNEKIFIFLDEIQKLSDFQSQLKIYFDLYPNIKFFISGSSSLFIRKKTQESLAGRILPIFLLPLSFKEYLYFTGQTELLEFPEMHHSKLETEYERYWRNQFIETIFINEQADRYAYLTSILKKIIFEDIPQVFAINDPEILYSLVKIIAQQPGMYLSYENLSNDLNLSSKTLSKYISILEQAFLIKTVYNFSKNRLTSEKKLKRVYLSTPSFSIILSDYLQKGLLAENTILSQNEYRFFWRDAYKHEVDFIDIAYNDPVPIEIKYKEKVSNRELQNLYLFAKKFHAKKAILLMKRSDKKIINYKDLDIELTSIHLF